MMVFRKLEKKTLKDAGFELVEHKVSQEHLIDFINEHQIEVLLVRSATQARKDLIDACPSLKIIGRGGVGMDNIDVAYAKKQRSIHYQYPICIFQICSGNGFCPYLFIGQIFT